MRPIFKLRLHVINKKLFYFFVNMQLNVKKTSLSFKIYNCQNRCATWKRRGRGSWPPSIRVPLFWTSWRCWKHCEPQLSMTKSVWKIVVKKKENLDREEGKLSSPRRSSTLSKAGSTGTPSGQWGCWPRISRFQSGQSGTSLKKQAGLWPEQADFSSQNVLSLS